MTADPRNTDRIEEYLSSQHQNVLSIKKVGGKTPAYDNVAPPSPGYPVGRAMTVEDTIPPSILKFLRSLTQKDWDDRFLLPKDPTVDLLPETLPELALTDEKQEDHLEQPPQTLETQQEKNNESEDHSNSENGPTNLPSTHEPSDETGGLGVEP